MNHRFESQTFIDGAAALRDACDWLSSVGIRYSGTRLDRYEILLSRLAELQARGDAELLLEEYSFSSFVNAAFEADQLIAIVRGLRHRVAKDPAFAQRMRTALSGHELHVLEKADAHGRNFAFELAVAARFAARGVPVDFSGQADVEATFESRQVFIECKRVRSAKRVESRVKEALDQLEKRYDACAVPEDARGFAALSIGAIANPEFAPLEAPSDTLLSERMSLEVGAFILEHQRHWMGRPGSGRTLGVLVWLDAPSVIRSGNMLTMAHHIGVRPLIAEDTPDFDLLVRIAKTIT